MKNKFKIIISLMIICILFLQNNVIPIKIFANDIQVKEYTVPLGELAIKHQFEEAYNFNEGVAVVKKDGKYGIIDNTGKLITPYEFDIVGNEPELEKDSYLYYDENEFRDGLLSVKKNDEWAVIDKSGKIIVPYGKYDYIGSFNEGLAATKKGDKWGYINKEGEVIIDFEFDNANNFSEELAAVKKQDEWGYIDKAGKTIIDFKFKNNDDFYYRRTFDFSEGFAVINCLEPPTFEEASKWENFNTYYYEKLWDIQGFDCTKTYINKKGEIVFDKQFTIAEPFKEGFARTAYNIYSKYLKEMNFIDKDGNIFLADLPNYYTHDFSEGLAASGDEGAFDYLYYDKNGNVSFEMPYVKFNNAELDDYENIYNITIGEDFSEGYALIHFDTDYYQIEQYYGFIDKKGNMVIPLKYLDAREFSENLAAVKDKDTGKWGYISNGNHTINLEDVSYSNNFMIKVKDLPDFKYDYIGEFSEGYAPVVKGNKFGYIDENGKEIFGLKELKCVHYEDEERDVYIGSLKNGIGNIYHNHMESYGGQAHWEIAATIDKNGNINNELSNIKDNNSKVNEFKKVETINEDKNFSGSIYTYINPNNNIIFENKIPLYASIDNYFLDEDIWKSGLRNFNDDELAIYTNGKNPFQISENNNIIYAGSSETFFKYKNYVDYWINGSSENIIDKNGNVIFSPDKNIIYLGKGYYAVYNNYYGEDNYGYSVPKMKDIEIYTSACNLKREKLGDENLERYNTDKEFILEIQEFMTNKNIIDYYENITNEEKEKFKSKFINSNILPYNQKENGIRIDKVYELGDNIYYVIGIVYDLYQNPKSEQEIGINYIDSFGSIVRMDNNEIYSLENTFIKNETLKQNNILKYTKHKNEESNINIDYSKINKNKNINYYLSKLNDFSSQSEYINYNGLEEIYSYLEYALINSTMYEIKSKNNEIKIDKNLLENRYKKLDKEINKINTYLNKNNISLNKELNKTIIIATNRINYDNPLKIKLNNLNNNIIDELDGIQIFLDNRQYIYIPKEAIYDKQIIIEKLSENKYKIQFLDNDGNVIEKLDENITFSLNGIGEYSSVFVTYLEGSDNWGGQYDKTQNTLEFATKYSGEYEIRENKLEINDLGKSNEEEKEAINFMVSKGIFTLDKDNNFYPDKELTRYVFSEALVKMFFILDRSLETNFIDLTNDNYYYPYVASGEKANVIAGYEDNTFRGDIFIPTEQVVALCARTLAEKKGYTYPENLDEYLTFIDNDEISGWAKKDIALAVKTGLIEKGGYLNPQENISREYSADILYRLYMMLYEVSPEGATIEINSKNNYLLIFGSIVGFTAILGLGTIFIFKKRKIK